MSDSDDHPDQLVPANGAPSREKAMGFWGHLEELRWTLVKSAMAFTVFAILIGCFLKEFNEALMWPMNTVRAEYPQIVFELGTMKITEGFSIIIQMCVLGGLVLASPFIVFFVGQFVSPALTEKELKAVLPLCGSAILLFLSGAAFSFFYLVTSTIRVSLQINLMFGWETRWTPGDYYSLLMWLVLGVGASFEFPLVIVLLVWLGVMTTEFLRKYRRHAIVVIFLIAAVVTPSSDPLTQTMFAIPLYVLYEVSIIASSRVEKRKRNAIG